VEPQSVAGRGPFESPETEQTLRKVKRLESSTLTPFTEADFRFAGARVLR